MTQVTRKIFLTGSQKYNGAYKQTNSEQLILNNTLGNTLKNGFLPHTNIWKENADHFFILQSH